MYKKKYNQKWFKKLNNPYYYHLFKETQRNNHERRDSLPASVGSAPSSPSLPRSKLGGSPLQRNLSIAQVGPTNSPRYIYYSFNYIFNELQWSFTIYMNFDYLLRNWPYRSDLYFYFLATCTMQPSSTYLIVMLSATKLVNF